MKKIITMALLALATAAASAQEQPQTATHALLKPHFTEASIKIAMPDAYAIALPEIHSEFIAVVSGEGKGTLYYDLAGKCIFGINSPLYPTGDYHYFSDGVLLCHRTTTDGNRKTTLLYPDGTYRDLPTGTKTPGGMDYDISLISPFQDGIALTWRGGLMNRSQVFVDKNFKEVAGMPKFAVKSTFGDTKLYPLCEGMRLFYDPAKQLYGYLNAKNAIAIPAKFHKAQDFSEGLAAVQITIGGVKKWGFIDTHAQLVVDPTYNLMPGRFTEGVAPVRIGTSESDYVMNYIDNTGKRLMPESVKRTLGEFHGGYAWVSVGCDGLFVIDREFKQVRDMTADFYHNGNGFGVCMFKIGSEEGWGIDFPGGMQALNQGGVAEGDIFKPDGQLLYSAVNAADYRVNLHYPTHGGLMFCKVPMPAGEARIGGKAMTVPCFINDKGEIVYYFVQGYEGFEGTVTPRAK